VHASQSQQVGSLMSEISHLTAEVGSLKMRLEMRGNNDTTSQQVRKGVCYEPAPCMRHRPTALCQEVCAAQTSKALMCFVIRK